MKVTTAAPHPLCAKAVAIAKAPPIAETWQLRGARAKLFFRSMRGTSPLPQNHRSSPATRSASPRSLRARFLPGWTDDELTTFAVVLAVGLALRIALITHSGFITDSLIFESWAQRGATYGVLRIYDRQLPGAPADYPPLLLYMYTLAGLATRAIQGDFARTTVLAAAMKLPSILAGCGIYLSLVRIGSRILTRRHGLLAGGLYFMMPASWLDSSVWGQLDAIYTLLLLVSLDLAARRRMVLAGITTALAITAKFQVVAFLPFLAVVAISWGWKAFGRSMVAFTATVVAVFLPFIITGRMNDVTYAYTHAVGSYDILSIDAFNIWVLLFGSAASAVSDLDTFAGIAYRSWGIVLFTAALAVILVTAWKRLPRLDETGKVSLALSGAAAVSLAFFLFPTEIHERYLFPFVAFAALWGTRGDRYLILYVALSFLVALNIAYVLPIGASELMYLKLPWLDRVFSLLIILLAALSWRSLLGGREPDIALDRADSP